MTNIKNIIFDLGGVLLNLDYYKTTEAFVDLGVINFEEMFSQFQADELFEKLETGKIDENSFYNSIKTGIPYSISNAQIELAWNAMLLDFRNESLVLLENIASKYKLFLLSNTNGIHLKRFQQIFTRDTGKPLLDIYFNKCWYSHLVGLRKPGKEIFEFVLQDAGIRPEETFFIDDSLHNIEAAKALGISSHHLKSNERIEDLFR